MSVVLELGGHAADLERSTGLVRFLFFPRLLLGHLVFAPRLGRLLPSTWWLRVRPLLWIYLRIDTAPERARGRHGLFGYDIWHLVLWLAVQTIEISICPREGCTPSELKVYIFFRVSRGGRVIARWGRARNESNCYTVTAVVLESIGDYCNARRFLGTPINTI